jgi:hypothetical protein
MRKSNNAKGSMRFAELLIFFGMLRGISAFSPSGRIFRNFSAREKSSGRRLSQPSRDYRISSTSKALDEVPYKTVNMNDVDGTQRKLYYIDIGSDNSQPPLVILVGTAQTVWCDYDYEKTHIPITLTLILFLMLGQNFQPAFQATVKVSSSHHRRDAMSRADRAAFGKLYR